MNDVYNNPNRSGFGVMSALLGGALWCVLVVSVLFGNDHLDLLALLLLLAMLVYVPLGLDLLSSPAGNSALYRLARFVQPVAALCGVGSFFLPIGAVAGVLASAWVLCAALIGLVGVERLVRGGAAKVEELSITVALLYLPIGAAWLAASRLGLAPLGFGGVIAFLTAIHFHFAGFVAPLLVGLAGRAIADRSSRAWRLYRLAACGIIAGPPLVAAGITLSRVMEVVAAVVLATSMTVVAVVAFKVIAPSLADRRARILLRISALASSAAMLLALLYAISNYLQRFAIAIPTMAMLHGCLNALFGLTGLLCWSIIRPTSVSSPR
jgi:hypothetical protein